MNFIIKFLQTLNQSVSINIGFIILSFILFIETTAAQSLKTDSISFIDYNVVINDLELNGSQSGYYTDIDFKKLISLDKSSLTTSLIINPEILHKNNIDTARINYSASEKYAKTIDIDKFSLEFILNSNDLRELFLAILVGTNYQEGIEIEKHINKKENIYIFSVFTDFWGETYRLIKVENQIRAQFLWC